MAEAELTTIARPYARAAFGHALEQPEGLARWSRMLGLLAAAINEPAVQNILDNPLLTTADETALLRQLMADDLPEDGSNFIEILAQYDRLALLPTISDLYELLKSNHEKTMDVEVTSAFEVSEAEKSSLQSALKNRLQREINIESTVDRALIGGVVIKAEDTVIDDSVRGRLERLSHALN